MVPGGGFEPPTRGFSIRAEMLIILRLPTAVSICTRIVTQMRACHGHVQHSAERLLRRVACA